MSFPLINPQPQFFDSNGDPLVSGTVEFRSPSSNALIDTFPTADDADAQTNANDNPLTLNSRGEAASGIFLEEGVKYKVILKDSDGSTVWTIDDVRCPLFTAANIGEQLYAQTSAESTAGVTPVDYSYKPYNVLRYGENTTPGTTDMTTAIQNAITACPEGGTVIIPDGNYLITGLDVDGKTNVRITGGGKLTNNTDADFFNIQNTVSGLTIHDLHLVGSNNASHTQQGIGNASGQSVSDFSFYNLIIEQTNNGISLNANLSGSYQRGSVYANVIKNLAGTGAGQGYGIHMAKAESVSVIGNTIINASRHSIYHAAGTNTGNLIANNVIRDHRADDNDANIRAAIYVARSSGVTVSGNSVIDGYDGGIAVSHVNSTSDGCSNILVCGNSVINRQNVVSSMYIGEQAVPTNAETHGVRVVGNYFVSDATTSSGGTEINILNGRNITISDNSFRWTNVAAASQGIQISGDSYISNAADCDYVYVERNHFMADSSGARAVRIPSELAATYTSNEVVIKDNRFMNIATKVSYQSTKTNGGIRDFSDYGDAVGVYTNGDATPSVSGVSILEVANTGATTITDLDDGERGQRVVLVFSDGNTTIDFTGTSLNGNAGVDWSPAANDHMTCTTADGATWYCDISDNSA